jgi:tripartite-type tricarboxylate transporter receptor subunit TctC
VGAWYGIAASAGMPKSIIDCLNAELAEASRRPAMVDPLTNLSPTTVADSAEQFVRFVAVESANWRKVVEASSV